MELAVLFLKEFSGAMAQELVDGDLRDSGATTYDTYECTHTNIASHGEGAEGTGTQDTTHQPQCLTSAGRPGPTIGAL